MEIQPAEIKGRISHGSLSKVASRGSDYWAGQSSASGEDTQKDKPSQKHRAHTGGLWEDVWKRGSFGSPTQKAGSAVTAAAGGSRHPHTPLALFLFLLPSSLLLFCTAITATSIPTREMLTSSTYRGSPLPSPTLQAFAWVCGLHRTLGGKWQTTSFYKYCRWNIQDLNWKSFLLNHHVMQLQTPWKFMGAFHGEEQLQPSI